MRGPNYPRDIGRPSWHSFAPSNPVGEWKGYESGGGRPKSRGLGKSFPEKAARVDPQCERWVEL